MKAELTQVKEELTLLKEKGLPDNVLRDEFLEGISKISDLILLGLALLGIPITSLILGIVGIAFSLGGGSFLGQTGDALGVISYELLFFSAVTILLSILPPAIYLDYWSGKSAKALERETPAARREREKQERSKKKNSGDAQPSVENAAAKSDDWLYKGG